jgi:hypothetical protein
VEERALMWTGRKAAPTLTATRNTTTILWGQTYLGSPFPSPFQEKSVRRQIAYLGERGGGNVG